MIQYLVNGSKTVSFATINRRSNSSYQKVLVHSGLHLLDYMKKRRTTICERLDLDAHCGKSGAR